MFRPTARRTAVRARAGLFGLAVALAAAPGLASPAPHASPATHRHAHRIRGEVTRPRGTMVVRRGDVSHPQNALAPVRRTVFFRTLPHRGRAGLHT